LECGDQLMLVGEQTFYSHGEVIPLSEFGLEEGLPVWTFRWKEFEIRKRLLLNQGQNTAVIEYALVPAPSPARLRVRPGFNFRGHDAPVSARLQDSYAVTYSNSFCEIHADDASLDPALT